jgi:NAD-dependent SIR2 family protein deacetylase
MSRLYLPVKASGSQAIAICSRCQKKVYHDKLAQDPNNKNWYCKECVDLFDPWRLPARGPDKIDVTHPRPDVELV